MRHLYIAQQALNDGYTDAVIFLSGDQEYKLEEDNISEGSRKKIPFLRPDN